MEESLAYKLIHVLKFAKIGRNQETLRDIITEYYQETTMNEINDTAFRLFEHITASEEFRLWFRLQMSKDLAGSVGGIVVDEFGQRM